MQIQNDGSCTRYRGQCRRSVKAQAQSVGYRQVLAVPPSQPKKSRTPQPLDHLALPCIVQNISQPAKRSLEHNVAGPFETIGWGGGGLRLTQGLISTSFVVVKPSLQAQTVPLISRGRGERGERCLQGPHKGWNRNRNRSRAARARSIAEVSPPLFCEGWVNRGGAHIFRSQ